MILIDKPYVSGFLKETILKNKFPVIRTADAAALVSGETFPFISEEEAMDLLRKDANLPLYASSENSIGWIQSKLNFTRFPGMIRIFKDKAAFRDLLQKAYPGFFYRKLAFRDLSAFDPSGLPFPVIIKPATGFFSLGVHHVENEASWYNVLGRLNQEISLVEGLYPTQVLDTNDFIIEEYIHGDEFAVDCYFNQEGQPVILNILHHLFSSNNDVSDRVYSTSVEIMRRYTKGIRDFLLMLGEMAGLYGFPAHVEIRITDDGRIVPIEVNPMRFGGWCTTADLAWHAWGFNAYEYYLHGLQPEWAKILEQTNSHTFSVVVLDNSTGIPGASIPAFDYDRLQRQFVKTLEIRPVDHKSWPLFGFVFCETDPGNMAELYRILHSDLREFVGADSYPD